MDKDVRLHRPRPPKSSVRGCAVWGARAMVAGMILLAAGFVGLRELAHATEWGAWYYEFADGKSRHANGDYAGALPLLEHANPRMPAYWWHAPRYAATCRMLGDCYLHTGQPQAAGAAYRRALGTDGKDAEAYYGLARVRALLGDAEEAANLLVTAVQLDPTIARRVLTDPYLRALPAAPKPVPSVGNAVPASE